MYQSDLERAVIDALEKNEQARDDDFILIGAVVQRMGVDIEKPFWDILLNHQEYEVPSFEQIMNIRRIVLYKRPDLLPGAIKDNKIGVEN